MPRKLIGVLQTSGMQGPPGPEGKPGPEGVAGKGFPVGGLTNQILAKKSDADYDTEWIDNNAKGNVESVNGKTGQVTLTAEDVGATTEQWVNQQNYLKSIPSEYITETELDEKGYLTEHQSLANYSTTEEMNNAISNHHDNTKQDKLTAGNNITIQDNVISATGGGSSNNDVFTFKSPTYYINNPDAEDTKEFYRVMQNLNLYKRYQILSTDLKLYPSTREYYVDILNIIKWNDEYNNGNTNITIQFNYLNAKSTNTIYIQQRAYSFTSTDYTLLNSSANNDWNFNITGDDSNRYVIKSQLSSYVDSIVKPWIRADNTSDSSLYFATEIAIMYKENDMWICHYYNYLYYNIWSSDSTLGNYGNQNQYFPTPQHPNGYWIYNGSDITFYNGIEDKIDAGYMHIFYRLR